MPSSCSCWPAAMRSLTYAMTIPSGYPCKPVTDFSLIVPHTICGVYFTQPYLLSKWSCAISRLFLLPRPLEKFSGRTELLVSRRHLVLQDLTSPIRLVVCNTQFVLPASARTRMLSIHSMTLLPNIGMTQMKSAYATSETKVFLRSFLLKVAFVTHKLQPFLSLNGVPSPTVYYDYFLFKYSLLRSKESSRF